MKLLIFFLLPIFLISCAGCARLPPKMPDGGDREDGNYNVHLMPRDISGRNVEISPDDSSMKLPYPYRFENYPIGSVYTGAVAALDTKSHESGIE